MLKVNPLTRFHSTPTKDVMSIFLTSKSAKGCTARTLETYRYRLRIFAESCPVLPKDCHEIERFLATTGPSLETRETYYRLLRNLYNALVKKHLIKRNPVLDLDQPKPKRKHARSLTVAELARLLNHPSHSTQLSACLYLLADTGLRISEALSITAQAIKVHTLIVDGKTGQREVPISPQVAHMVLEALPWPWLTRTGASHAIRKAFHRAGITGKRASAHALRHSFVRLWEGDESLLVNILGWTSPAMLKVYKPYNLDHAVAQHHDHTPLRLVRESVPQLALL